MPKKKNKKIDLYTFIYNDEDFLPFFLDYYSFVDSLTFIDSGSTDNSLNIIKKWAIPSHPLVRVAQTGLTWWDHDTLHEFRNEIWKDSRADIVFFPDCDEIFFHPDMKNFLDNSIFDIFEMDGYEMVWPEMPPAGSSILQVNTGVPFHIYDKSTIFNPRVEIEFLNAHLRYTRCTNVNIGDIKLLHYRSLGLSYMLKRRDRIKSRTPRGYIQIDTDQQVKEKHARLMREAKVVI